MPDPPSLKLRRGTPTKTPRPVECDGIAGVAVEGKDGLVPNPLVGGKQGNLVVGFMLFLVILPVMVIAGIYWSGWLFYTRVVRRRPRESDNPWG